MEYSHIQTITDGFGPRETLDYKFETLIDIADHFRIEHNEDLKRGLEDILRKEFKDLILEFDTKSEKLKSTLATLKSSY